MNILSNTLHSKLIVLAIVVMPVRTLAGPMTSGGTGLTLDDGNPWFLGDKPISYCISIDEPSFSRPKVLVQADIAAALADWGKTLRRLGADRQHADMPDGPALAMATEFVYVPECSADVQLRFEVGTSPEVVQGALRYLPTLTLGMALRTHFDRAHPGATRGIVWFAPDQGFDKPLGFYGLEWNRTFNLPDDSSHIFYNGVLHELGHVFGIRHQDGTFLAEDSVVAEMTGGMRTSRRSSSIFHDLAWRDTGARLCASVRSWWGQDISTFYRHFAPNVTWRNSTGPRYEDGSDIVSVCLSRAAEARADDDTIAVIEFVTEGHAIGAMSLRTLGAEQPPTSPGQEVQGFYLTNAESRWSYSDRFSKAIFFKVGASSMVIGGISQTAVTIRTRPFFSNVSQLAFAVQFFADGAYRSEEFLVDP